MQLIFKKPDGSIAGQLNPMLISEKNLSEDIVKQIIVLHESKEYYYSLIESIEEVHKLKELVYEIEKIEFALQRLWGFPENKNYHRWWETPKCICPKIDNEKAYGTMNFVVNDNCPLHGSKK